MNKRHFLGGALPEERPMGQPRCAVIMMEGRVLLEAAGEAQEATPRQYISVAVVLMPTLSSIFRHCFCVDRGRRFFAAFAAATSSFGFVHGV